MDPPPFLFGTDLTGALPERRTGEGRGGETVRRGRFDIPEGLFPPLLGGSACACQTAHSSARRGTAAFAVKQERGRAALRWRGRAVINGIERKYYGNIFVKMDKNERFSIKFFR